MSAPRTDRDEVTTADIAAWRGWSRITAWRWLAQLEKEHGPTIVARRGRRLFTTREALARVAPAPPDARLDRRLKDLETKVGMHETRITGLAKDVSEFRRKSNEWFREHGKT